MLHKGIRRLTAAGMYVDKLASPGRRADLVSQ
jgi:hypothetical protein